MLEITDNSQEIGYREYEEILDKRIASFFSSLAGIYILPAYTVTKPSGCKPGLTVIVKFDGVKHGFLAINCSEELTYLIASNMLEATEELSENDLFSALGEAADILTSDLLETIPAMQRHIISVPTVVRSDKNLLHKLYADNRRYSRLFLCGTENILVKFVIHLPNCLAIETKRQEWIGSDLQYVHNLFSCARFGNPCMCSQGEAECKISISDSWQDLKTVS